MKRVPNEELLILKEKKWRDNGLTANLIQDLLESRDLVDRLEGELAEMEINIECETSDHYEEGYDAGYQEGYDNGYCDAEAVSE